MECYFFVALILRDRAIYLMSLNSLLLPFLKHNWKRDHYNHFHHLFSKHFMLTKFILSSLQNARSSSSVCHRPVSTFRRTYCISVVPKVFLSRFNRLVLPNRNRAREKFLRWSRKIFSYKFGWQTGLSLEVVLILKTTGSTRKQIDSSKDFDSTIGTEARRRDSSSMKLLQIG